MMDGQCDLKCLRDPPCKDKIKLSDRNYQEKLDKANGKASDGDSSSSDSDFDSDTDSSPDSGAGVVVGQSPRAQPAGVSDEFHRFLRGVDSCGCRIGNFCYHLIAL